MDCMKYGQYLEYTSLFADSRDFSVTLPDENCGMHAFDGCLTIVKGENSLVLETRQANLFGRKTKGESLGASSPKSVNDVISTYLRPDEPLRYDINNRSLQKHF